MAAVEVRVDDRRVQVRLDALPDNVRNALRSIVQTLDNELLSRVQSKTPVRTGKLESSFRGHVRSTKTRVSGSVDVDKGIRGERGIAAIIESGASVPAHEILPDAKKALAFLGSAGQVFAARVQHPANKVPAFHMLSAALDEMESDIVTQITETVRNAAAGS